MEINVLTSANSNSSTKVGLSFEHLLAEKYIIDKSQMENVLKYFAPKETV